MFEQLEDRTLLNATPTGESYFVFEDWSQGNTWSDVEKTGNGDSDLCWAAAGSNILAWGGWDVGEMDTPAEIFEHIKDFSMDTSANAPTAWRWWFTGESVFPIEANGDGYFPEYNYPDGWYSGGNIDDLPYLFQTGYGVALSLSGPGGHAVTCWGFNYDANTEETLGIWITDSDDNNGNLRYYEVEFDGNTCYLQNYYGSDAWYIRSVNGLMANPETLTPSPDATVTGRIFDDSNQNGALDEGESGLVGVSVLLDTNGNGIQDNQSFTTTTPVVIHDETYVSTTLTVSTEITSISDLNLTLDITHAYNADLTGWLIAPDGTKTTLFAEIGGSGDNFDNVTFDDEAATSAREVSTGTVSGTLRPFYNLSVFDGLDPTGDWTLKFYDNWRDDTGTLNSWSLNFTEQVATTNEAGQYSFTDLPDGDYSVIATTPDGYTATGDGATRAVTLADGETQTVDIGFTDGGGVENQAPVISTGGNRSVNEEELLSFTVSASDPDDDNVTLSATDLPTGADFNASTGVFTWRPTEAQDGTFTVTFTATDDGSPVASASETITITVIEVNSAPVLATIGNQSVNEEEPLTFTATATDADLPADTLTYSLSGDVPSDASIDASSGDFSWTPTEAHGPGTYTFDVVVSDGSLTDSETITVTVLEVNAAPVLAPIGDKSIDEEQALSFTVNASDPDDTPANNLTLSVTGLPTGASFNAETGVFSWTPSDVQAGTYSVTFTATDDGSPNLSDSETITITVSDPPVIEAYFVFEDWSEAASYYDVEKDPHDYEDDLLCWAAAASNTLAWGGWAENFNSDADAVFEYMQEYTLNRPGNVYYAWQWWLEGGEIRNFEDGAGFFPDKEFDDYYRNRGLRSQLPNDIHMFLQAGYSTTVTLQRPGYGHVVTCWGINYDSVTDTYAGIWITDSDDDKYTSTPENELQYYALDYSEGVPKLQNYYNSDDWYLYSVAGFAARSDALNPLESNTVSGVLESDNNPVEGVTVVLNVDESVDQTIRETHTATSNLDIADLQYTYSSLQIDTDITHITDLNVSVDISHTAVGDLVVWLIAPSGEKVVLTGLNGGTSDTWKNVTFDDDALIDSRDITYSGYSGSYLPNHDLHKFNGLNPNGEWVLKVYDSQKWDGGTINEWSLSIEQENYTTVTDCFGNFRFENLPDSDYDLSYDLEDTTLYSVDKVHEVVFSETHQWDKRIALVNLDLNNDDKVGHYELDLIRAYWGAYNEDLDFNKDGVVASKELDLIRSHFN